MNIELEQKSPLSHCCRSAPSRETRKELSSLDFLGCFLRQFNVTSACQETDITCTCHPACSPNPMCLPQKRENWIKFIYSEKVTNFCEIFTLLLSYIVLKVRWRFCKILWPSQNIWTLTYMQLFQKKSKLSIQWFFPIIGHWTH